MSEPILPKLSNRVKANQLKRKYLGHKFNHLTILEYLGKGKVMALCDCGNKKEMGISNIIHGTTKACGCQRFMKDGVPHGHKDGLRGNGSKRSSEYGSYTNMLTRCYNINFEQFQYWGGRGIIVCERWRDKDNGFTNFYNDMGPKPEPKKLYSIDRINNDGNYEPSNCRWVTRDIQANNQRTTSQNLFMDCHECQVNFSITQTDIKRGRKYCTSECYWKAGKNPK